MKEDKKYQIEDNEIRIIGEMATPNPKPIRKIWWFVAACTLVAVAVLVW